METTKNKDVIVALDFPGKEPALNFLDKFQGKELPYVKIGMELFYREGPSIVREIKERGHKIFLDLKLHDIPNTVEHAMESLGKLDIDMCNVHASGTLAMMEAARKGIDASSSKKVILIAVTQLTSTSQERMQEELLINSTLEETVEAYAINSKKAGLDGVVCSPREAELIHRACGYDFLTVTPGVRFAGGASDDQVRITTPAKARELGSDFIVVGRPITKAEDPVTAYQKALKEFLGK